MNVLYFKIDYQDDKKILAEDGDVMRSMNAFQLYFL